MNGGPSIRAVGHSDAATDGSEPARVAETETPDHIDPTPEEEWLDEGEAEEAERAPLLASPIATAIAALALIGWTVLFVASLGMNSFRSMTLDAVPPALVSWSIPTLLILFVWHLASQRASRQSAHFRATAKAAVDDIAELEARLSTVNRELSLAREFLTRQTRELESHGRVAASRLSQNADRIEALVAENGEEVERIARVSETALANMAKLRDDLPVITNASRDAANAVGSAGERAQASLDSLTSGLSRLNEFGEAGERHVEHFRSQVDRTLTTLGDRVAELEAMADARFTALRQQSESFRTDLDGREVEALAAAQARIDKLRERLTDAVAEVQSIDEHAMGAAQTRLESLREEAERIDENMKARDREFVDWVEARRTRQKEIEEEALGSLETRLEAIDAAVKERRESHVRAADAIAEASEAAAERLSIAVARIDDVAGRAGKARDTMVEATDTLEQRLTTGSGDLAALNESLAEATEAGVRLLELIQAGASHSREVLPSAMEAAEARLKALRENGEKLRRTIEEGATRSEHLSAYILDTREKGEEIFGVADRIDDRLAKTRDTMTENIASLRTALALLDEEAGAVSEATATRVSQAVEELETAADKARAAMARYAGEDGSDLGAEIGENAATSLTAAMREQADEALEELREATRRSAEAARDAARQLRDQLSLVSELAGNLETRVSVARERAEEQVDNDFARRVALITESLNSNAIDIAKALSSEVTDTAWASYLRGDRGVFTRRAVRLLDNRQAREIAELYDEDDDFRDHVNRYIHDFEAMLRTLLSTRDGNALAVTLLGSEVGKLYVAMAQALERLRAG
ncbi:coiled-coil domain-containing protein [Alteriqipengyuania lutimaris]|uniref:ATPase n=1 Tax=Alteriqipengyuania lutimaris TaxID=1538146 RepID=A0A395LM67_9SPHN|nr:ATPase [Alteriqipengyuania lutimaris]MBB3032805.1 chromosome segregation ATPase [Alteriqipengyuania lutimaris]RDS78098.1 ATPase [Alteriqipengyuania lutimaris]